MSLTLQPVSSNFFLLGMGEPGEVEAAIMSARVRTSLESAAAARNRSLESINRNAIKEELTNQWLEGKIKKCLFHGGRGIWGYLID